MDIYHVPPDEVEAQVNEALSMNVRRFVFSYPILALVTGFQSGFISHSFSFYWLVVLGLLVLAALRYWQCLQYVPGGSGALTHWRSVFTSLSLINISLWMLLVVWVVLTYGLSATSSIWLIVTIGIASGGASSMSPLRPLALSFITLATAPVMLAFLCQRSVESLSLVFCIIIFYAHIVAMIFHQSAVFKQGVWDRLRLEWSGRRDALTGVFNRGYFNQLAEKEWQRSVRNGQPIALLLLDLDHFKGINDNHGHLVGDQCLRLSAELLVESVMRPSDVVARFGGEEFVVLLPETEMDGAIKVAERICAIFAGDLPRPSVLAKQYQDIEHIGLTVSVGVAVSAPKRGESLETLIASADKAMYQAKAQGRNQVCRGVVDSLLVK